MSWTINGAQRMARLIRLREIGQLHSWIPRIDRSGNSHLSKQMSNRKTPGKHAGDWLEARIPALYGPHQNRHWARILRAITYQLLET